MRAGVSSRSLHPASFRRQCACLALPPAQPPGAGSAARRASQAPGKSCCSPSHTARSLGQSLVLRRRCRRSPFLLPLACRALGVNRSGAGCRSCRRARTGRAGLSKVGGRGPETPLLKAPVCSAPTSAPLSKEEREARVCAWREAARSGAPRCCSLRAPDAAKFSVRRACCEPPAAPTCARRLCVSCGAAVRELELRPFLGRGLYSASPEPGPDPGYNFSVHCESTFGHEKITVAHEASFWLKCLHRSGNVRLRQPFPGVMSLSTITVAESASSVKTKSVPLPPALSTATGIQSDLAL